MMKLNTTTTLVAAAALTVLTACAQDDPSEAPVRPGPQVESPSGTNTHLGNTGMAAQADTSSTVVIIIDNP